MENEKQNPEAPAMSSDSTKSRGVHWYIQLAKDKEKWDSEIKSGGVKSGSLKDRSPIKELYELSHSEWNSFANTDVGTSSTKNESSDFFLQEENLLSSDVRYFPVKKQNCENQEASSAEVQIQRPKSEPRIVLTSEVEGGDTQNSFLQPATVSQTNSPESALQTRSLSMGLFHKPKNGRRWFPSLRRSSTSVLSTNSESSRSISISKGSTASDESFQTSSEQMSQTSLIASSSSKECQSNEAVNELASRDAQELITQQNKGTQISQDHLDDASDHSTGSLGPEETDRPRRLSLFFAAATKRRKEKKQSASAITSPRSSLEQGSFPRLPGVRDASKYSTRLRKAVQQLESKRISVKGEHKKLKATLSVEKLKWKRYAQHDLISMAWVLSDTLAKKEELEVEIITLAIDHIVQRGVILDKAILQTKDGHKVKKWVIRNHTKGKATADDSEEKAVWLPEDFVQTDTDPEKVETSLKATSEYHLRSASEIMDWALREKQVERHMQLQELQKKTERMRVTYDELCGKLGRSAPLPVLERSKKVAYLVFCALQESIRMTQRAEHGKSSSEMRHFYLHPLNIENQLAFQAIVADTRTSEGKFLVRWESLLSKMISVKRLKKVDDSEEKQSSFQKVVCASITKFRSAFVKQVIDSLRIVPITPPSSPLTKTRKTGKSIVSENKEGSAFSKPEKEVKSHDSSGDSKLVGTNSNPVKQEQEQNQDELKVEQIYGSSPEEATRRTKLAVDLYIERLLFTRLANLRVIFPFLETKKEREWNKSFRRKANWLCILTQEQVGIAPKFRATRVGKLRQRRPYHLAVEAISKLTWMVIPSDIFQQIMVAMRLIHQQAQEYVQENQAHGKRLSILLEDSSLSEAQSASTPSSNVACPDPSSYSHHDGVSSVAHKSLSTPASDDATTGGASTVSSQAGHHELAQHVNVSADDLFPLVCWVVIHAHVPLMHTTIGHLERFLSKSSKTFGEMAMCLTLLQAAVVHIGRMELDQFDFPEDIKEAIALAMQQNEPPLPAAPLLGFHIKRGYGAE